MNRIVVSLSFIAILFSSSIFANDGDSYIECMKKKNLPCTQRLIDKGRNFNILSSKGRLPIVYASSFNRPKHLKLLLDNGAEVDKKNKLGDTALGMAGTPEIAKMLISKKADLNLKDNYFGNTPLINNALIDSKNKILKVLIDAGAKIDIQNKAGASPLMIAAKYGALKNLKDLIKAGANLKLSDVDKSQAVHLAVEENKLKSLRILIDASADIDAKGKNGSTPLMISLLKEENPEMINYLLDSGADIGVASDNGLTPLMRVLTSSLDISIIKKIASSPQDFNASLKGNGMTALHFAVINKADNDVLDLILKGKPKIDKEDKQGRTPLFMAVKSSISDTVLKLIEAGANPNSNNKLKSKSPFILAISQLNYNEVDSFDKVDHLFRSDKLDPNQKDKFGKPIIFSIFSELLVRDEWIIRMVDLGLDLTTEDTESKQGLLHYAVLSYTSSRVVKSMLDHGAKPNTVDRFGKTPLHYAAGKEGSDLKVRALLTGGANVNALDSSKKTALHIAVERLDITRIEEILNFNPNVYKQDNKGASALLIASQKKDATNVIKTLLFAKSPVSGGDQHLNSPLHYAAELGEEKSVDLLCTSGAFAHLKNRKGQTASDLASLKGFTSIVERLKSCSGRPDLVIDKMDLTYDKSSSAWSVKVVVHNRNPVDMNARFEIKLMRRKSSEPKKSEKFTMIEYSKGTLSALKANEKIEVEWRTDIPTATGNRIALKGTDGAIRVVLDGNKKVTESFEINNQKTLVQLRCWDEVYKPSLTAYFDLNTSRGVKRTTDLGWDKILRPLEDTDVMQAVLCKIKLEAQRRSLTLKRSVKGSKFLGILKTQFLDEVLANPKDLSIAQDAIDKLSEYQTSFGIAAKLWVPEGVKELYSPALDDYDWLFPATEYYTAPGHRGKYSHILRLIDVPFLVGGDSPFAGSRDHIAGGRNTSQVMHWATAISYSEIPEGAFRDLFIGYEYWHLEGWDVFGEDAINDLIAEEEGRMLGLALRKGKIVDEKALVNILDTSFKKSRAWVGAMIRHRIKELDALVIKKMLPEANLWWKEKVQIAPWAKGNKSFSFYKMNATFGATAKELYLSQLAERITQIYTVAYDADEWERETKNKIYLSPTIIKTLDGKYDTQFKKAPKGWRDTWDWMP